MKNPLIGKIAKSLLRIVIALAVILESRRFAISSGSRDPIRPSPNTAAMRSGSDTAGWEMTAGCREISAEKRISALRKRFPP